MIRDNMENGDEERREARSYRSGLILAVLLSALPFALVWTGALPRAAVLAVIGVAALVQVVVQFRYFLHIDLSRQKREDLQLILFSALVLLIVVGGTVWVLGDLGQRMMPGMTGP
jgi:cytochrome o ubiquinol oxidase operon protein cyoD